jgi:tetratricopeptide (TPR) repeat protein
MKMRKILIGILFLVFVTAACNRKNTPAGMPAKLIKTYDTAAYEYIFVEAVKQKVLGSPGDAIKYFERCIEINPESDAAYYQIAQILLGSGDVLNAKKYASKAVGISPDNLWYLMMNAGIYYQEKNIDSALIFYERAVKLYPSKDEIKLTLGNLYSESGDFERARDIFSSFDEKYGVNETTTTMFINALIKDEKYREALEKVGVLLKDDPDDIQYNGLLAEIYRGQGETNKAFEVYNDLITRNPDNPGIQLALMEFLLNQKNYSDLITLLKNVAANDRVEKERKIELFAGLIGMEEIVKDYFTAMEDAIFTLEKEYESDQIIVLLRPDLYEKSGKLSKAAERLEELSKAMPENYFAQEKLLLLYYDLQDMDKLLVKAEQVATKFNRSFLAKILYATAATEKLKYETALEELRKAEILAGDNREMLLQVLTMRADVYYRIKDFENSFKLFDEAIALNSEDLTILNNYAYYLAEQDLRIKEAEQMAKKVIETEKDNTTFLDTYAWTLYKRGKLKEAARIMERIINMGETDDAEWYEHYGFILRDQKKCAQAIRQWEHAIKLDSSKGHLNKEIEKCGK